MSIAHLHDDMLLYLTKHFVGNKDCVALALSDANERFTALFGENRRRLVVSQCYFIGPDLWKKLFQNITPSLISVLDVSHCYWLPADVFVQSIVEMINLQELSIQDTKISLANLPQVFEACQKIVKFSFSLKEPNLDQYQKGVMNEVSLDWMKKGFAKVTHLKIFTFIALSVEYTVEPWLATLGVFKWCRDCTDLFIKIAYKRNLLTKFSNNYGFPQADDDEERTEEARTELLPHLGWMKTLKSLVVLRGDSPPSDYQEDYFIQEFISWLKEVQGGSLISLERFWIDEKYLINQLEDDYMTGPLIKSLVLPCEAFLEGFLPMLFDERFQQLEHLAEIIFYPLEVPDIKYIRGEVGMLQFLDEFFQDDLHPKLEQLHIRASIFNDSYCEAQILKFGDWNLLSLKILTYYSYIPSQRLMEHLMKACPNIEQLHIVFSHALNRKQSVNFFRSIQLNRLTWLSISGDKLYNGLYFYSVVKKCPNLERLHLAGVFETKTFFGQLALCLPTATNLRDLRLKWKLRHGDIPRLLRFLKALQKCSSAQFERLALDVNAEGCKRDLINYATLEDSLVSFVKKMTHLVALSLTGFQIDRSTAEHVHQRLLEEIIPHRPSFWFHLSSKLPEGNDTSVPRIHMEEMVNPIDPWDAPPQF